MKSREDRDKLQADGPEQELLPWPSSLLSKDKPNNNVTKVNI